MTTHTETPNSVWGFIIPKTFASRPIEFPLAARAMLRPYRASIQSERGLFLIDVEALSASEAQRIAVHYFLRSKHRNSPVTRITAEIWS